MTNALSLDLPKPGQTAKPEGNPLMAGAALQVQTAEGAPKGKPLPANFADVMMALPQGMTSGSALGVATGTGEAATADAPTLDPALAIALPGDQAASADDTTRQLAAMGLPTAGIVEPKAPVEGAVVAAPVVTESKAPLPASARHPKLTPVIQTASKPNGEAVKTAVQAVAPEAVAPEEVKPDSAEIIPVAAPVVADTPAQKNEEVTIGAPALKGAADAVAAPVKAATQDAAPKGETTASPQIKPEQAAANTSTAPAAKPVSHAPEQANADTAPVADSLDTPNAAPDQPKTTQKAAEAAMQVQAAPQAQAQAKAVQQADQPAAVAAQADAAKPAGDGAKPRGTQRRGESTVTTANLEAPKATNAAPQATQTAARAAAPAPDSTVLAEAPASDTPQTYDAASPRVIASKPSDAMGVAQDDLTPELIVRADPETPAKAGTLPETASASSPVASPSVTAVAGNNAAPAQSSAAPSLPMTESSWPETLVEQIEAMSFGEGDQVEIVLSPERLGKLRIQMELRDGAATVQIITDNPEAARLFNDQQGRLSEMLQKAGLDLAGHQAGTGSGQRGERGDGTQDRGPLGNRMAADDAATEQPTQPRRPRTSNRIDVVA
ncbi:flagellar hook-length control protein FliK [Pseudoprimorskyibacter insulae]|uniref:Flagellar hook-length control protein-like C-terminal domain-containing protein n=1 Tax=Pseudoprimorskyibacter insulae TaxID=1695997 RepID=A0A2R8AVN0_9RHOB|nr:flagellar hook-length control protein FliK [Pseudoprimorskyibacter insulae]SPF80085.1 hypothetical protein PRI8871_01887 [Pseudoprimorskyibacter insulae]